MTAAAERCHLTLAAVSSRVRQLEETHGVALLQRLPRGVATTPAGEVLARHARLVFEQVQRMEQELLHADASAPARFVLLANSSALARPFALPAVQALAGAPLAVRESSSEASVQALRSGAADLAIVSDAVDTRGLEALELGADPLVVVTARTHAFAQREALDFAEAIAQPWIGWSEQGALATHLLLRALAAGKRIEPRVSYPAIDGVLQLVAAGEGITVLPRVLVDLHARDGAVIGTPLRDAWAQRRLFACHATGAGREDRTAMARALAAAWPTLNCRP
jgi:DNA-binding transcriptional LysR family regulator